MEDEQEESPSSLPPMLSLPFPFDAAPELPSVVILPDPDQCSFPVKEQEKAETHLLEIFADGIHIFINNGEEEERPKWRYHETVLIESVRCCVPNLTDHNIRIEWHRAPDFSLQSTVYDTSQGKEINETFFKMVNSKIDLRKWGVELRIYKYNNAKLRKREL